MIYETTEEAAQGVDQDVEAKPKTGISVKDCQTVEKTSLMIGRESSGLSNEELELCDATVNLDLPGYSSMNQSHATAALLHELNSGEAEALKEEQKKAMEEVIGDGKIKEVILRGSPTEKEFDRLMGELNDLEN